MEKMDWEIKDGERWILERERERGKETERERETLGIFEIARDIGR